MKKNILLTTLAVMATLLADPILAADIVSDTRSGANGPNTQDGGYLELGIGTGSGNSPRITKDDLAGNPKGHFFGLGLFVGLEYRYKNIFFEATPRGIDGIQLGYTLWNNADWSVDVLAASGSVISPSNRTTVIPSGLTEEQRNVAIVERKRPYVGAGIRVTGYLNDYIVQFLATSDYRSDAGYRGSIRLGRNWQIKNWNVHGIVAATYRSADTNQHFYGISADEATTLFPEYKPGSSVSVFGEIGATYPITQDWVFRSALRYSPFPDAIKDSPLFDGNYGAAAITSISYVF